MLLATRSRRILAGMVRGAASILVLVGLLAGCGEAGGGSSAAWGSTDLTMVALNPDVGRAVFHLRCSPSGGDFPDADKACAALAAEPGLITDPEPFTCGGSLFSWWDVTVSGELDGKAVRKSFSTCWTPQMETLARLGLGPDDVLRAHLVSRREESVLAGEEKVFPAGVLRPTDLVTCDILGHHLEMGVPVQATGQPSSTGYSGANVEPVMLEVALNQDGSVSVTCHRGE